MEQSPQKSAQLSQKREQLSEARAERLVAFLAQMYPVKMPEMVASDTGISAGTIRQWLARSSAPNFKAVCKLICAYGPEILCIAMDSPPAWLSNAARVEKQARLEREMDRLRAEMERT